MKQPRIHPLLVDIIQSSLLACDGLVFDRREVCPVCGGELAGYDTKKRQFAVILKDNEPWPVHVLVKRFSCRQCRAVCYADEPFYPDTRLGSPVVDLCRTLAGIMPFHRTTAFLAHMGIFVDRGTVRNYALGTFPEIPTTDLFGIRFPLSVVSLSTLAAATGEGGRIIGTEALAACGFPSAFRAPPDPVLPKKRYEGNKQKRKEERQSQYPEDCRQDQ
jgi:hypothetical protein